MIRYWFSLGQTRKRACAEIMLEQRDDVMIRSNLSDRDSSGDPEDFG
jgi:hypothetical protein